MQLPSIIMIYRSKIVFDHRWSVSSNRKRWHFPVRIFPVANSNNTKFILVSILFFIIYWTQNTISYEILLSLLQYESKRKIGKVLVCYFEKFTFLIWKTRAFPGKILIICRSILERKCYKTILLYDINICR